MKRVLFTSMNVGGGHRMPALAIEEALHQSWPGKVETAVVDLAHDAGALWTDAILKKSWDFMLAHPGFTNAMYDRFLNGSPTVSTRLPHLLMRDFLRRAPRFIGHFQPDLVVSTYFFCTLAALRARRRELYSGPIVQVIVDPFTAHPWWAMNVASDEHIVASRKAFDELVHLGVPAQRIVQTSFPLRGAFERVEADPPALRRRLGLIEGRKTILISPGGEGITNIPEFVKSICRHNVEYNVVYVCGRSTSVRHDMERFLAARPTATRVAVLGYVDNMHELIQIADLAIAKPGASTTMEMLAMRTPVIFTQYCGYQEESNVEYVVNNRLGWYTRSVSELLMLLRLINESNLIDVYRARHEALGTRSGSLEIAGRLGARLGLC